MTKALKKGDFNSRLYWFIAFPLLFGMATLFTPEEKAQDFNNPCFFCHMNVIVEHKNSKHADVEVSCETCHGPSEDHIDVEDNSIKPDSIFTDKDVHLLCKDCHGDAFVAYEKSGHAKLLLGINQEETKKETKKSPSCVTCHGAHELKLGNAIKETCMECHTPLPQTCKAKSLKEDSHASLMVCKGCHVAHSLEIVMKETPNDSTLRQ